MDWSIREVAHLAGATSRTLRHYGAVGLLPPSRVGSNGTRHYDQAAIVRLQRILVLRDLGLGLPAIAKALDETSDTERALASHLVALRREQERLTRQIASVERTLTAVKGGEHIMAADMLDGFDHTAYREEVENRWGAGAYRASDAWWRGLGPVGQQAHREATAALQRDWIAAVSSGVASDSVAAQSLADQHVAWLRAIPGTPAFRPDGDLHGYLLGLGDMYVVDERFAVNYGGAIGAAFVRDALRAWVAQRG